MKWIIEDSFCTVFVNSHISEKMSDMLLKTAISWQDATLAIISYGRLRAENQISTDQRSVPK